MPRLRFVLLNDNQKPFLHQFLERNVFPLGKSPRPRQDIVGNIERCFHTALLVQSAISVQGHNGDERQGRLAWFLLGSALDVTVSSQAHPPRRPTGSGVTGPQTSVGVEYVRCRCSDDASLVLWFKYGDVFNGSTGVSPSQEIHVSFARIWEGDAPAEPSETCRSTCGYVYLGEDLGRTKIVIMAMEPPRPCVAGEQIGGENALFPPIFRPCRTRRQEAKAIITSVLGRR